MIILGISGFEDLYKSKVNHVYSSHSKGIEEILCFSDKVPLQFYPLQLIGHDCSAALLVDGKLVACAAEERFTRIKHGFNLAGRTTLPRNAINYCLKEANISWDNVDYIAHYCNFTKDSIQRRFENVAQSLDSFQRSQLQTEYEIAYKNRLAKNIIMQQLEKIAGRDLEYRLIQVKHHLAHAAGAFFSSHFEKALILTLDGYGETESSIWAIGRQNRIYPENSIELPTSLGLIYQIITAFLGFRSFGDEYKVMGLASYGNPEIFKYIFDEFITLRSEGAYSIQNLSRPDLLFWLKNSFGDILPDNKFSQKKADIAAALQKKLEETILHSLTFMKKKYAMSNLCLSGGVGLNACANGAILRSGLFDEIFIQPAAADDGASLGAALYVQHNVFHRENRQPIDHVFWGPGYCQREIENTLQKYKQIEWKSEKNIEKIAADLLAQGKIVGWFKGRMEMGPRALGARSILADPRSEELEDKINQKIKNRECFRPFAPIVLKSKACKFFDIPDGTSSPFMLMTFNTHERQRKRIPAVVHVDGSSRLQTVTENNPGFYHLLRYFYKKTGIPILLNTSFNRAGEPIVNSPDDALQCFLKCGLDALVIEDYIICRKSKDE